MPNNQNPAPQEVPSFVRTDTLVEVADLPSIIAEKKTVYAGLQPVNILIDVEGDGNHLLYRVVGEFKRFGLVSANQLTTIPLSYIAYMVDGQEFNTQQFNIREASEMKPNELEALAGVLEVTKLGETIAVSPVYMPEAK